jgi:hypothetical protein
MAILLGGNLYSLIFGDKDNQVGVYDSNFRKIAEGSAYSSVEIGQSASTTDHPVESGEVFSDYAVSDPITITIRYNFSSGEYQEAYDRLKRSFLKREFLSVVTGPETFDQMVMVAMPFIHRSDRRDTISLDCSLKQVRTISSRVGVFDSRVNKIPSGGGEVSSDNASEEEVANVSSLKKGINSIFGG